MDAREHLRALVDASPEGAMLSVPRAWLVALLGDAEPGVGPVDLTVTDLAERFDRSPSTVRGWVEVGKFPGAYRLQGREWRVPAAGLAAFEEAERGRVITPAPKATPQPPRSRSKVVNLGDWQKVS